MPDNSIFALQAAVEAHRSLDRDTATFIEVSRADGAVITAALAWAAGLHSRVEQRPSEIRYPRGPDIDGMPLSDLEAHAAECRWVLSRIEGRLRRERARGLWLLGVEPQHKITAVRALRDLTGLGLRECNNMVNAAQSVGPQLVLLDSAPNPGTKALAAVAKVEWR